MPENMSITPWVQIAAFCQTTLQEANGAMSIIRLVDRHLVVGSTEEMQPTTVNLILIIVLKSGNMQGSATMTVAAVDPNGEGLPPLKIGVLFEGLERGPGLVTQIGLVVKDAGLYWFDVLIDGVLLTRIPLRILYQQAHQIVGGQHPTS